MNALLALGTLSHLDEEIGARHSFEKPHPGWCVAYGRDRDKDDNGAHRSESVSDLVQRARRLFIQHVFVWAVNPQTGAKAWAILPMPEETETTVGALVEEIWQRDTQSQTAPLGIVGTSEKETPEP